MDPRVCGLFLFVVLATSAQHQLNKRSPYKAYGSRGCLDLRSKRYISDGFCTTVRPVAEAVCVARCEDPFESSTLSTDNVSSQVEWRCTQGATRRKTVRFLCRDGSRRKYRIRLVTKCNCKKVQLDNNHSREKALRKMKKIQ